MKKIIISIIAIVTITLLGFSIYTIAVKPTVSTPPTNTIVPSTSSVPETRTITTAELAKNNGQEGNKCWIAVNGTIYDVTGNSAFNDGTHKPYSSQVQCGGDESAAIGHSPHGAGVLSKLPVIGTLAD